MQNLKTTTKHKPSIKYETHRNVFVRFLLILAIFITYFVFISTKYGYQEGFVIAWLTWSFFVLCTPIADAGMLIDFPARLVTGIRMVFSEMMVWAVAISFNVYVFNYDRSLYDQTQILTLFKHILLNPWPLWIIIIIAAFGTFLSIQIGDELMDVIRHKDRKLATRHDLKMKMLYMVFVLVITFALYDLLLTQFNFDVPI